MRAGLIIHDDRLIRRSRAKGEGLLSLNFCGASPPLLLLCPPLTWVDSPSGARHDKSLASRAICNEAGWIASWQRVEGEKKNTCVKKDGRSTSHAAQLIRLVDMWQSILYITSHPLSCLDLVVLLRSHLINMDQSE